MGEITSLRVILVSCQFHLHNHSMFIMHLFMRLIGKEWMSQGHEIVVFAPTQERVGGRILVETEDEKFVYRNWGM